MSYSFPTDATDGDKVQLDNGIEYIYQADKDRWMVNSSKDGLSGHFVKRQGGDSMEGPLSITTQPDTGARDTRRVNTLGVFSNTDGSALRLGTTRDRVYVGHNDTSFNGPIRVDEIQEKTVGEGVQITDRVILKTEGVEDDEAVTKKYIDDVARHIQDEIVELEEEIDAIAPSVERGRWTFTAVGTVAQPGQFTMYDADFGNGSPTGLFKSAKSIWFNELDLDGTPHSFANVKDGELLEIFIDGSPEYGLFSVIGEAHDETATGSKFWVVDVDFVRTNESTTAVGPGEICRFKIFEAPSGGEATSFVMKSGDTMSGNLTIDKSAESTDAEVGLTLKGNRSSATNPTATIAFDNKQSSAKGYFSYRSYGTSSYFKFNRDVDLNNNGLHSVGQIRMEPNGGIGSGNNTRLTFHSANSGQDGEGLLVVPRPVDNRRGFVIRGNNADGDEQDILWSFTNTGNADAVNYAGKITSDNNLVNKLYVDDQMAELVKKIEELEMASRATESHQFQMYNKTLGGSTEIGPQISPNEIMSCANDGDVWNGQDTHHLSSEYRYIYVCFPDGYRLNSAGQMSVVGYNNADMYDARNSNVATYHISGVEACPPDKSAGKNIYRAVIQLDAYKPSGDSFYPSWGEGNLYITFSGGALTKTSATTLNPDDRPSNVAETIAVPDEGDNE